MNSYTFKPSTTKIPLINRRALSRRARQTTRRTKAARLTEARAAAQVARASACAGDDVGCLSRSLAPKTLIRRSTRRTGLLPRFLDVGAAGGRPDADCLIVACQNNSHETIGLLCERVFCCQTALAAADVKRAGGETPLVAAANAASGEVFHHLICAGFRAGICDAARIVGERGPGLARYALVGMVHPIHIIRGVCDAENVREFRYLLECIDDYVPSRLTYDAHDKWCENTDEEMEVLRAVAASERLRGEYRRLVYAGIVSREMVDAVNIETLRAGTSPEHILGDIRFLSHRTAIPADLVPRYAEWAELKTVSYIVDAAICYNDHPAINAPILSRILTTHARSADPPAPENDALSEHIRTLATSEALALADPHVIRKFATEVPQPYGAHAFAVLGYAAVLVQLRGTPPGKYLSGTIPASFPGGIDFHTAFAGV